LRGGRLLLRASFWCFAARARARFDVGFFALEIRHAAAAFHDFPMLLTHEAVPLKLEGRPRNEKKCGAARDRY
jgi:hypothetical protein